MPTAASLCQLGADDYKQTLSSRPHSLNSGRCHQSTRTLRTLIDVCKSIQTRTSAWVSPSIRVDMHNNAGEGAINSSVNKLGIECADRRCLHIQCMGLPPSSLCVAVPNAESTNEPQSKNMVKEKHDNPSKVFVTTDLREARGNNISPPAMARRLSPSPAGGLRV